MYTFADTKYYLYFFHFYDFLMIKVQNFVLLAYYNVYIRLRETKERKPQQITKKHSTRKDKKDMKNTKNYTINFITKEITITKKFAKAAGSLGTPEFKEMMELRNAYPDFNFKMKESSTNENKRTYSGLTVLKMIAVIEVCDSAEKAKEFRKKISVFEGQRSKYPMIKKYFLSMYQDILSELSAEKEFEIETVIERLEREKVAAEDNKRKKERASILENSHMKKVA